MKQTVQKTLGTVVMTVVVLAMLVGNARAETAKLKRVFPENARLVTEQNWYLLYEEPQTVQCFFTCDRSPESKEWNSEQIVMFNKLVNKEPEYDCEWAMRGVARFCDDNYPFVLDIVQPDDSKDASHQVSGRFRFGSKTDYNRLYIDMNRNGDLSDDRPVDSDGENRYGAPSFPNITIPIRADGQEFQHMFSVNNVMAKHLLLPRATETVTSNGKTREKPLSIYTGAISFWAIGHMEGEIEVGGVKHQIAVKDCDSNGRYDDTSSPAMLQIGDNTIWYPLLGDKLVIDPQAIPTDVSTDRIIAGCHYLGQANLINGAYYHLDISPSGKTITAEPVEMKIGYITPTYDQFRAWLINDQVGVITLAGNQGDRIPVPAGDWDLFMYQISSDVIAPGSEPQRTTLLVSGSPKPDGIQPLTISEGQTLPFPSRAPLVAEVSFGDVDVVVGHLVQLRLKTRDAIGYRVKSLTLHEAELEKTRFTITAPDGTEILRDSFEYG